MSVLVATASVHTTAAACDYLGPTGEEVVVLTVTGPAVDARDAGDAANVARTRLPGATVETVQRDGGEGSGDGPATAAVIREVAAEYGVDRVVVGATRGDPERSGEPPGSTARALLAAAGRPVVVLPV